MPHAIGIDLGESCCRVAGLKPDGSPLLLANMENERTTPTVGEVIRCFERGEPVPLDGRQHDAGELLGGLVARLKAGAEERLGEPVEQVVVAVPAGWDEATIARPTSRR